MKALISLKWEDCYCDLTTFYENVARKHSIEVTPNTIFDCRKICVTRAVQSAIQSYYREKKNRTDEQIAAMLLGYGPKANLVNVFSYEAEIEDGFVEERRDAH